MPGGPAEGGIRHVGYVLKKYPRLSETFILDELLGLEAAGVEVSIFSLRLPDEGRFHRDLGQVAARATYLPESGSSAALGALEALGRLDIFPDRLRRASRFLELLPEGRRAKLMLQAVHLAGAALEAGVEHLHAHFMTVAAQVAHLAHLLTDIPFSVTAHAKDVYRTTVDPALFEQIAHRAVAVVTVCEANRRFIEEELVRDGAGRIRCIYNGVFLDRLSVGPVTSREAGLVLAVGRLVEKKGFEILVRACRLLLDRGAPLRCLMVGDGDRRGPLEELVGSLGVGDHVELMGPRPRHEVLDLMRRAQVLAAPCVTGPDGNRDALPTVLLEALAVGLPVVATPVGGIPEIVDDGVEGLVVPEGDPRALADALERILGDEPLRAALGRAGRRKAEARFDRARNLQQLMGVFAGRPDEQVVLDLQARVVAP